MMPVTETFSCRRYEVHHQSSDRDGLDLNQCGQLILRQPRLALEPDQNHPLRPRHPAPKRPVGRSACASAAPRRPAGTEIRRSSQLSSSSDLCHPSGYPAEPRSSATRLIDKFPGGFFLHRWFAPSGRTAIRRHQAAAPARRRCATHRLHGERRCRLRRARQTAG